MKNNLQLLLFIISASCSPQTKTSEFTSELIGNKFLFPSEYEIVKNQNYELIKSINSSDYTFCIEIRKLDKPTGNNLVDGRIDIKELYGTNEHKKYINAEKNIYGYDTTSLTFHASLSYLTNSERNLVSTRYTLLDQEFNLIMELSFNDLKASEDRKKIRKRFFTTPYTGQLYSEISNRVNQQLDKYNVPTEFR